VRLESNSEEKGEAYEPLWAQIDKSFRLREEGAEAVTSYKPGKLTRPHSPNFLTKQRFSFRQEEDHPMAEDPFQFKAAPFNPKIFSKLPSLPEVERKGQTSFQEF